MESKPFDPAAVDAAIAEMNAKPFGILTHAHVTTITDAVEHYRQQLAAVTERAERMRAYDPLETGCQWEDARDIACAVHSACVAIIDGNEPNQEGNADGK